MKLTLIGSILACMCIAFTPAFGHGDEEHDGAMDKTVKGEVVDLSCFLNHGAKGAKHKQCAIDCAKKGLPMAVLTEDGSLYLLIENHSKAAAYKSAVGHAGDTITVEGAVRKQGGINAIEVEKVD